MRIRLLWPFAGTCFALALAGCEKTDGASAPPASATESSAPPAPTPSTPAKTAASQPAKPPADAPPASPGSETLEDFADEVESSIDSTNYKKELNDLEKALR